MRFGEVLKYFKDGETADTIVPLVESAELRSAIVAWKSVVISYKDAKDCEEQSESRQWEWMWSKVDFDIRSFGVVAGCRPQDVMNLFERLKGLRLIYPDGTINTFAKKYLQSVILSKLPKPPKSSTPK